MSTVAFEITEPDLCELCGALALPWTYAACRQALCVDHLNPPEESGEDRARRDRAHSNAPCYTLDADFVAAVPSAFAGYLRHFFTTLVGSYVPEDARGVPRVLTTAWRQRAR